MRVSTVRERSSRPWAYDRRQFKCVFGAIPRLQDDEGGRSESVLDAIEAAALFAGVGFGSAAGAVPAVGCELAW